jgi:hypothetical protein
MASLNRLFGQFARNWANDRQKGVGSNLHQPITQFEYFVADRRCMIWEESPSSPKLGKQMKIQPGSGMVGRPTKLNQLDPIRFFD